MTTIKADPYIFHLTPDDKFIDLAYRDFEALLPGVHRVFVIDQIAKIRHIRQTPVQHCTLEQARLAVIDPACTSVIFHALPRYFLPVLEAVPFGKPVIWIGWGYDIYDLLLDDTSQSRLLAETRQALARAHGALDDQYVAPASQALSEATCLLLGKIHHFVCLETEYEKIRNRHPWFKSKHLIWSYGCPETDYGVLGQQAPGPNLLVGNSASPENNHLEVFKYIHERVDWQGRQIVVPLSYGDMAYRQQVLEGGRSYFGEAFQPLMDFMSRDDYAAKLQSCGYVFMNHARQQAVGSVAMMMLQGARLFLNDRSLFYKWLDTQGALVEPIDSESGSLALQPLSAEERLHNRGIALSRWGHFAHLEQTVKLLGLAWPRQPPITFSEPTVTFSVVMPVYNRERYVREAIESVLAQSDPDFELLVVDDGSTDSSLAIIRSIDDPRLRLICTDHGGGAAARNYGIEAARGEFIIWVDSDDRQAYGALTALREASQAFPDADVLYGDLEVFDDIQPSKLWRTQYPDFYGQSLLPILIRGNCLPNPGTAVRRALYAQYGGYDTAFVRCHDFQMWTRLADSARFKKVEAVLCQWRQHGESLSSAKTRAFEAKVARDMFDRYPVERIYPDLPGGDEGRALGLVRLSETLEELGEFAAALRTAHEAQVYGANVTGRIQVLEDTVGTDYEPTFSVIVTTFNRPDLLEDALASLEHQTFRDFEIILVNDRGMPVEALLAPLSVPVSYLRKGRNQGLSAARNSALRLARGRYVTYLDDDDLYRPHHLAQLAHALRLTPDAVVYTGVEYVIERLEDGKRHEIERLQPYRHERFDSQRLFVQNYIPVNTFAHPRVVLASIGGFDESLTAFEDWDLLLHLAKRLPFYHVPEVSAEVHMRQSGTTDHMLGREQKNFGTLYQRLYQRHGSLGDPQVAAEQDAMLARLGISRSGSNSIDLWMETRRPTRIQEELIAAHLAVRHANLCMGIVILDQDGDVEAVGLTLESLRLESQVGPQIRVMVLTQAAMLQDALADRPRVEVRTGWGSAWVPAYNQAIRDMDSDWCLLVKAGETFTHSGLLLCALELLEAPDCRAIYADGLQRGGSGALELILKPDFNLDLFLSFPRGLARHWLLRRDLLLAADGFTEAAADAAELDFLLRLVEEGGLAGLGHVSEPLLISDALKVVPRIEERAAILRHLRARGYDHAEVLDSLPGCYRLHYNRGEKPRVSVLIPVQDRLAAAQRCVMSVLEQTQYEDYEVLLLDNAGTQPAVRQWLLGIDELASARIRVLRSKEPLEPAALLNAGAGEATGSYLVILDPLSAVFRKDWLEALLNHALRPEVAVVGAKTVDADGRITHAGVILGLQGVAGRAFVGEPQDSPGYMNRLQVDQNYSAVSGGCFMIRAQSFQEIGGFTEDPLMREGADVDLCLRLGEAGYLIVWTPHAVLLHGADPVKQTVEFQDHFYARWLPRIARDSAYNVNLSLVRAPGGFTLTDTQLSWKPLVWRPVPVVMAHYADTFGCGHYRLIQPFHAQREAGLIEGVMTQHLMHVADLERYAPDVVVLQRQIGDERLEAMRRMKLFSRAFTVYELDDYLPNLPLKSIHREDIPRDILRSLRRALSYTDRFVVSTEPLAEAFAELHPDIRVAPNRLNLEWWANLPASQRRTSAKPRVGWAGGSGHTGDLELLHDVVRDLANEVDWVFLGMCPPSLRPYVKEFHAGVEIGHYPALLASLNLDLALAPLEYNQFNECKSNLRLLEYGICGFPVVCSDLRCYAGDLPVTRVKNRYRDWIDAIRMHLNDLDECARQGDLLRERIRKDWMLEGDNLQEWYRAWQP